MARILVAGADATIAERRLVDALVERMQRDGHDALRWTDASEGPSTAAKDCDAIVAVLDRLPTDCAVLIAYASALDKPVLGLSTAGVEVPEIVRDLVQVQPGREEGQWMQALPDFYDHIRPFAGRLVRDRIPELVKQAGHDVQFRQLTAEERPRFLKQKVANEAKELMAADIGQEKEEVSDLLEALEAFIAARGFSRDDLRRVKEHKKKQRGGFSQGFVVEATSQAEDPQPDEHAPPEAPATAEPTPEAADPRPSTQTSLASGEPIDFEYTDEPEEPEPAPEDLAPGREVKAEFFEL